MLLDIVSRPIVNAVSPSRALRSIAIYSVTPHQQQKIYLDQEYPCPCHPHGKLQQIVLTEAFGCNRCHRIFVLQADGLTIEELAATYPYKRRYYWNGQRLSIWRSVQHGSFWTFGRWRIGSGGTDPDRWTLWLQYLSVIALLLVTFQLYCRITLTSSIFNLVLSMAIAIVVLTIITIWLFDQG
jgi:hypothetical protein